MRTFVSIVLLLTIVGVAQTPPVSTTTRPATNPSDMRPLLDGSLRYLPPDGWKEENKLENGKAVTFVLENGRGRIDLQVQEQDRHFTDPESARKQMAMIIGKGIRDSATKNNREIIMQPKVEPDDRFFLIVHDKIRGSDGGQIDRLQMYRLIGLNMVFVAVNASTDDEAEAKQIHDTAKQLLDGLKLTRGATPVTFGKTKIKITTPVDWKVVKTDQPNGLVATYTDPSDATRQIIVRSRVLPKDARTDETKREGIVTKAVDDDRRQPPLAGLAIPATEETVNDTTVLRRIRTTFTRDDKPMLADTRYLAIGDVLLSVRTVRLESDNAGDKVTDALIASLKPVGP